MTFFDSTLNNANRLRLDESVSIAVAAHGNAETSKKCLECLFGSVEGSYELILIDDCSPDNGATRRLFCEARVFHPNARVLSFSKNLEYTGSVDAVLSHAKGDLVFFLSNDIFATGFYFANLIQAALSNPPAILRGSSNFVDNEQATHNLTTGREIRTLDDVAAEAKAIASRYGTSVLPDKFLVGDAFLVSRPVIDKIGTFDPFFYGYFGDHDYGLRAKIAGFPLLLVQGAYAYHDRDVNLAYLPEEEQQAKLDRRWMRVYENWARFKIKYDLPISETFPGSNDVPWDRLAAKAFSRERHYSKPGDYSGYMI